MKDPLLHRTFGVLARGPGLVRQSPNVLATAAKTSTLDLSIHVLGNQAETIEPVAGPTGRAGGRGGQA